MSTHEQIVEQYETYLKEHEAFETKGVKAAAARARKALGEIVNDESKRDEISDEISKSVTE